MVAKLKTTLRDNRGLPHKMGEQVDIVGQWMELGTHRVLLRVTWPDGSRAVLLPADVELEKN